MVPQNNNSNIKDDHNKYNYNESLKYCYNCQNVTQKHKVSKCCWKNCVDRLAQCRVATDLQFVKKKKKKCSFYKAQ